MVSKGRAQSLRVGLFSRRGFAQGENQNATIVNEAHIKTVNKQAQVHTSLYLTSPTLWQCQCRGTWKCGARPVNRAVQIGKLRRVYTRQLRRSQIRACVMRLVAKRKEATAAKPVLRLNSFSSLILSISLKSLSSGIETSRIDI
jgi:hypothetical protein